ncbi:MAG: protein-disulfide reductase DsbD [Pseudomonadota bacterium]|nr:protein-disulfide reductase DsbD [Pseudomonadota bacterium]
MGREMPVLRPVFFIVCICLSLAVKAQTIFDDKKSEFLPVDTAFQIQNPILKNDTIIIGWLIEPGYYLYKDQLVFKSRSKNFDIQTTNIPVGSTVEDPLFGTVQVFEDNLTVFLEIGKASDAADIEIEVGYQGCAKKGLCYPPQKKNFLIINTASEGSDENSIYDNKNILMLAGTFFMFGVLLSFTPCVLPMLPILSSVILGLNRESVRISPVFLSAIYVVSMALTYAIFGAIVATVGEGVQSIISQELIILFLILFLVLMSVITLLDFSFSSLNKFNNRMIEYSKARWSGPFLTAAGMGSISAFVATPCVTPPLAAALAFILQTNSMTLGFVTLFFLGLGMGAPLMIVGSSFNFLIPKTGQWMLEIKFLLAFLLLGTAIWFAERLVSQFQILIFWSVFTVVSISFFAYRYLRHNNNLASRLVPTLAFIILLLNYGIAFFDSNNAKVLNAHEDRVFKGSLWLTKASIEEIADYVKSQDNKNEFVLIKFYADWCIECKHIENNILTDEEVIKKLNHFTLINVDVTEMIKEHKKLLKEYSLYGPPAFIVLKGKNLDFVRKSIGSINKEQLMDFLELVKH